MLKGKHAQFEVTKEASEPESDMVEIFELSDQAFKINMSNMLRTLMSEVNKI